jgi:HlyD family secretion protein
MRKWLVALPLGTALLAACSENPAPHYQGYVEGEYLHLASPVAGRLESLLVSRGQTVVAGAPLFKLEANEELAARDQAQQQLNAAQAQLADMQLGKRKPELGIASAQLNQARASEEQARQQLTRDEAQFAAGGIARSQLDDARSRLAIQSARVREITSQLELSHLPARTDLIRAQSAQASAAQALLRQQNWRLEQKQLSASVAGLVADTLYRPGEWVTAGSPVLRLLPPTNIKVRFFVPETVAGALKPGRQVVLRCDGCPGDIAATVNFIADAPEFTPPVIYSNESRAKMVFMVEARPAATDAVRLRPGQPVAVALK